MAKYVTVKYGDIDTQMDVSKLTFAEARAIEKVTGQRFSEMQSDGELFASMDMLQAMVWVTIKRAKPGFKFSDLDDVPMGDIEFDVRDDSASGGDDANPQDSADPAADH